MKFGKDLSAVKPTSLTFHRQGFGPLAYGGIDFRHGGRQIIHREGRLVYCMTYRPYPHADCVWLASDQNGHVAAFVTAGTGPIPTAVLQTPLPVEESEALVCSLPTTTTARLLVSVPRPDSFVDLAERGLFVYDWHEHRIDGRSTGVYEAVATPNDPVCFGSLTGELAEISKVVTFGSVSFMDARVVDVRACAQCCESDGYCGPKRRWN